MLHVLSVAILAMHMAPAQSTEVDVSQKLPRYMHSTPQINVRFLSSLQQFYTADVLALDSSLWLKSLLEDNNDTVRINQAHGNVTEIDITHDMCPDDSSNTIISFWQSKAMNFFTLAIHQEVGHTFAKLDVAWLQNDIIRHFGQKHCPTPEIYNVSSKESHHCLQSLKCADSLQMPIVSHILGLQYAKSILVHSPTSLVNIWNSSIQSLAVPGINAFLLQMILISYVFPYINQQTLNLIINSTDPFQDNWDQIWSGQSLIFRNDWQNFKSIYQLDTIVPQDSDITWRYVCTHFGITCQFVPIMPLCMYMKIKLTHTSLFSLDACNSSYVTRTGQEWMKAYPELHVDEAAVLTYFVITELGIYCMKTVELKTLPVSLTNVKIHSWGFRFHANVDFYTLPPFLHEFSIYGAKNISGNYHLDRLPQGLIRFSLRNNLMTGSIDLTNLPSNLTELELASNDFEGTVDLTRLPHKLKVIDLSINKLKGRVDLKSLPKSMTKLWLNFNNFNGSLNFQNLAENNLYIKLDLKHFERNVMDLKLSDFPINMKDGNKLSISVTKKEPDEPFYRKFRDIDTLFELQRRNITIDLPRQIVALNTSAPTPQPTHQLINCLDIGTMQLDWFFINFWC